MGNSENLNKEVKPITERENEKTLKKKEKAPSKKVVKEKNVKPSKKSSANLIVSKPHTYRDRGLTQQNLNVRKKLNAHNEENYLENFQYEMEKEAERKIKNEKKSMILAIVLMLFCLPVVVINMVTVIKTINNKDNLPNVFGVTPVIVTSGSISDAFEKDDLILIRNVDMKDVRRGDIVCYNQNGVFKTEKVEQIKVENSRIVITINQDGENKAVAVSDSQFQGVLSATFPKMGKIVSFIGQPFGAILLIGGVGVVYLVVELIIFVNKKRKYSK